LHDGGLREAIIVTGYLGEMIEAYFSTGTRVGMRLLYHRQHTQNGTAAALMSVEELCGDAPFLLHWGDILIDPVNYRAILDAYACASPPPTCMVGLNWMDDPAAGAAVYQQDGRITRIIEKPPPGTSTTHWNSSGIMVLAPRVWPYVRQVQPSPRGEYEFPDALQQMIATGELVLPFELQGIWRDIGTPEVLAELEYTYR